MVANSTAETFDILKAGFRRIGYGDGLLQENYEFADILGAEYTVRHIPIATFAQDPPSYRNACFGVVAPNNGRSGSLFVQDHKSLGAPQILEVRNSSIFRWKMTSKGIPLLLEETTVQDLPALFIRHQDDWSPANLLRAKSAGDTVATQLDFLDSGLLPLLEHEVRIKLDRLLRDTIILATEAFSRRSPFLAEYYPPLFRLIFRLIAAKVLADRRHPGDWMKADPQMTVKEVERFYFRETTPEPVLQDHDTQLTAWERIKTAFHFQNLSVDSLAYVYENTLVTPETRAQFGIHGTPPSIAEYVVRHLPFETLATDDRRVFEPFAGHAVFLVAAMQRLRELLPIGMTTEQRHQYFVRMLSGIEIDDFAREVARLSLMLADYPNPDGWRLHKGDVFASPTLDDELAAASVVLCNPPFEEFSSEERSKYRQISSTHKPAVILQRVLQKPPRLLGFVLPRVFVMGRGYKDLRSTLGRVYSSIEVLALPDRVFQHSDAETVLLLAYGKNGQTVHLHTGEVYKRDLEDFYITHKPSLEADDIVTKAPEEFSRRLWLAPLRDVWRETEGMPKLGEIISVHRGIEYNLPFLEHKAELVSDHKQAGFVPGVHRVEDTLEPFLVEKSVFLNMSTELMRTFAYKFPWDKPKLIVNAHRRSRGNWQITVALDRNGLVCYRNFYGIWTKRDTSLEVLSAVMNGPLANAFVAVHEGMRYIRAETLKRIPVPDFRPGQEQSITALVRQYVQARSGWVSGDIPPDEGKSLCSALLKSIDAEVLQAYDLPPRLERTLLDYFTNQPRPGPAEFNGYFPPTFKPFIPWHMYISEELRNSTAAAILKRLPVVDDQAISEALSYLE